MLYSLIPNTVYYRIFAKDFKDSTHLYAKYRTQDATKITDVKQNKNLVMNELGATNLLILKQIHGSNVIDADIIDDFEIEPESDGAVTSKTKIALAIQTADCVPVLLTSEKGDIIGAAHCGWRSAKDNIIEKIINKMRQKGANAIHALVGPAIQQASYEVSAEFYKNFLDENTSYQQFFIKNNQHYMFDLPAFVHQKLTNANIDNIITIKDNTYSLDSLYPSYRRMMHNGEEYNQNILSTIIIKK